MILGLRVAAAVSLLFSGFLCLVFGSSRGNQVRRVSSHVIFFYTVFMIIWYLLVLTFTIEEWEWTRDDTTINIPTIRFLTGFTVITVFTSLVVYATKQNALNILLHVVVCFALVAFVFQSCTVYEAASRRGWIATAWVLAILLLFHIFREQRRHLDSRFLMMIGTIVAIYVIAFLVTTMWSPMHQNLITMISYDAIMTGFDIFISLICAPLFVQYSWAVNKRPIPPIKPGYFTPGSGVSTQQLGQRIDNYHTF
jgi:hypothetical protein